MSALVNSVSTADSREIRDSFETGLAELVALADLSPSKLIPELEIVIGAYESVRDVLADFNWDTVEFAASEEGEAKLEALAAQESGQAFARIGVDASERCKFDLEFNAETVDTIATLPQPPVPDDTTPEREIEDDEGRSATVAMGLIIAERYELQVSDEDALCIGKGFESVTLTGMESEDQLDRFYRGLFAECEVAVP